MSTDHRPQVVRGYLRELDAALDGLPEGARRDIVDGVAGDLDGLDAAAAAARIEQLGDPAAIASDARAGFGTEATGESSSPGHGRAGRMPPGEAAAPPAVVASETAAAEPVVRRAWFVVLTALVVAIGGFVVPLVGWIVGIVLMWLSTAWTRAEKLVATIVPLAIIVGIVVVQAIGATADAAAEGGGPVLPPAFALWSAVAVLPFAYFVVGIWLLWRGLRRR